MVKLGSFYCLALTMYGTYLWNTGLFASTKTWHFYSCLDGAFNLNNEYFGPADERFFSVVSYSSRNESFDQLLLRKVGFLRERYLSYEARRGVMTLVDAPEIIDSSEVEAHTIAGVESSRPSIAPRLKGSL